VARRPTRGPSLPGWAIQTATAKTASHDTRCPQLPKRERTATSRDTSAANVLSNRDRSNCSHRRQAHSAPKGSSENLPRRSDLPEDAVSSPPTDPAKSPEAPPPPAFPGRSERKAVCAASSLCSTPIPPEDDEAGRSPAGARPKGSRRRSACVHRIRRPTAAPRPGEDPPGRKRRPPWTVIHVATRCEGTTRPALRRLLARIDDPSDGRLDVDRRFGNEYH
jgi:hypothetical protein